MQAATGAAGPSATRCAGHQHLPQVGWGSVPLLPGSILKGRRAWSSPTPPRHSSAWAPRHVQALAAPKEGPRPLSFAEIQQQRQQQQQGKAQVQPGQRQQTRKSECGPGGGATAPKSSSSQPESSTTGRRQEPETSQQGQAKGPSAPPAAASLQRPPYQAQAPSRLQGTVGKSTVYAGEQQGDDEEGGEGRRSGWQAPGQGTGRAGAGEGRWGGRSDGSLSRGGRWGSSSRAGAQGEEEEEEQEEVEEEEEGPPPWDIQGRRWDAREVSPGRNRSSNGSSNSSGGQSTEQEAYQKALSKAYSLVYRRAYSRQELRQKLAEKGHPRGAIEQAIARLTEVGELDDVRYAAKYVESKWKQAAKGPAVLRQELARKGIDRALAERTLKSFFGNTRRLAVVPLAPTGYGDEEGQEADEEGGGSSSIMGAEELGYGSTGGGVGLFSRDARPLIPLDRGHAGKGTGDQVAEEDGEQGSQSAGSLHHGSQGGGAGGAAAAAGRQEEEEDLNFPDPESASSERGGQLLAVAARRLQSLRQQPEEVQRRRLLGWLQRRGHSWDTARQVLEQLGLMR